MNYKIEFTGSVVLQSPTLAEATVTFMVAHPKADFRTIKVVTCNPPPAVFTQAEDDLLTITPIRRNGKLKPVL